MSNEVPGIQQQKLPGPDDDTGRVDHCHPSEADRLHNFAFTGLLLRAEKYSDQD